MKIQRRGSCTAVFEDISQNSAWYQEKGFQQLCKENSWVVYSVNQDSTYCFACRHFSLPSVPESAFTSQSGFCIWKKALFKDSGFKLHSKAEHHINAMYAWNQHKRGVDTNSSMLDTINEDRKKKVEENCAYIKTIADVLLLTATQNIAQRGHREPEDCRNKGNFLTILEEIAKHDPLIEKRMHAFGNAKYTRHQIQNEVLEGLAQMVQSEIIREVKESEVFRVIADETKERKKKNTFLYL